MARRSDRLIARNTFYIITNGEQTEFNYFKLLKAKRSVYDVKIIFENAEEGIYVITIPEGYLMVSDIEEGSYNSQPINITFTVDYSSEEIPDGPTGGVSGIEADANGNYIIYNLNGVNVANTGDASAISNLNKGIYIINGKKVIVK